MTQILNRYALKLEYLGTHFRGWQSQKDSKLRTIQKVVEEAISKIADEKIEVICAGRTDAGVHAVAQMVHFDTSKYRKDHIWLTGINAYLPHDCSAVSIKKVSSDFHARYKALGRHYRYYLYVSPNRSALLDQTHLWINYPLDIDGMQKAAQLLLGTHDFSAFRSSDCQAKTPIRTLYQLNINELLFDDVLLCHPKFHNKRLIAFDLHANAFLHNMVRNLVGSLLEIGAGKRDINWIYEVLTSKNRGQAGMKVLPNGLFFVKADYPTEFDLPS